MMDTMGAAAMTKHRRTFRFDGRELEEQQTALASAFVALEQHHRERHTSIKKLTANDFVKFDRSGALSKRAAAGVFAKFKTDAAKFRDLTARVRDEQRKLKVLLAKHAEEMEALKAALPEFQRFPIAGQPAAKLSSRPVDPTTVLADVQLSRRFKKN